MKEPRNEKSGLDAKSPNVRIETADPALSKEKDQVNSTHHPSAVPGCPEPDEPDPLAATLMEPTFLHYWSGYRHGHVDGIRHAHDRAEAAAAKFLAYLAEDPEATPLPLPPLENDWRGAA